VVEAQDSQVVRLSKQPRPLNSTLQHVREAIAKPDNTTSHRLAVIHCWSVQHRQPETQLKTQLQNVLDLELTQV
jgi:hypothetical protein